MQERPPDGAGEGRDKNAPRRFQFHISTLLILTALVAGFLGLLCSPVVVLVTFFFAAFAILGGIGIVHMLAEMIRLFRRPR